MRGATERRLVDEQCRVTGPQLLFSGVVLPVPNYCFRLSSKQVRREADERRRKVQQKGLERALEVDPRFLNPKP